MGGNLATELWFKEEDKKFLQEKILCATARAGDRTHETLDPKGGYKRGEVVLAKIQLSDEGFDEWQTELVVDSSETKSLGDIEETELFCMPEGQRTKEELKKKLGSFYGRPFLDGDIVTIIAFHYKEN